MDSETACWVGFSVFPGIGPLRFRLLRDYFGSAKSAWRATAPDLIGIGLGEKLVRSFDRFRREFSSDSYMTRLARERVWVLTLTDARYPKLLGQIPDAPFVLYVKGKRTTEPVDMTRTVAVVGTRKITPYGREVTRKLATGLAGYGITVVSGLAYGVDAVAHESAIAAGGLTVAVLGCGVDIIAPPSNAGLYSQIIDGHGAIVSEMPLGLRPGKGLFPARNRIISGLSLGVVVTEGADDSGALITAGYAADQGREVFAVPGPITSRYSAGPARLIRSGATLVESAEDILDTLGLHGNNQAKKAKFSPSPLTGKTESETKILKSLCENRLHIDAIVRDTGLTISEVAATLTVLEIRGIVRDYGEKVYGLAEI